jgi:prepilin peptidase CpaA
VTLPQLAVVLVALTGCVTDIATRRLPNALTFGAATLAFVFFVLTEGLSGLGFSMAGWAVGLAMFLPLFVLGGLGGGDVKLLAALGAWLGPGSAAWLALWSMAAGGPIALAVALSRGYTRQAFSNVWGLLMFWRVAGLRPRPGFTLDSSDAPRIPYSVPIAVGLLVTLWLP